MTELRLMKPGETTIYYVETGHGKRSAGAFAAAWDAQEQGLVTLCQRRKPGLGLEYVAVRI